MADLSIKKVARQWVITYKNVDYSTEELADITGLRARSITSGLHSKDEKTQIEWISDLIWKKENGVAPNITVYRRGSEWYTIQQVVDRTKCSRSVAYKRLREWVEKIRDTEQLFEPALSHSEAVKKAMANRKQYYHKQDSRDREERKKRLDAIPGPTDIERALWGF